MDVWGYLDMAYNMSPETRDRITQVRAIPNEVEREKAANELLHALWSALS